MSQIKINLTESKIPIDYETNPRFTAKSLKPEVTRTNAKTSRGGLKKDIEAFKDSLDPLKRTARSPYSPRIGKDKHVRSTPMDRLKERLSSNLKDLYKQYKTLNFNDIIVKSTQFPILKQRLLENDKCVKKANMAIFYFLNFYKEFETKVINGKYLVYRNFISLL